MVWIVVALASLLAGGAAALAGPMHEAAREGDVDRVRALIAAGEVIDVPSERGDTPLIVAILAGQQEVAELLLEQGAALDGRNTGGFTPLHAAAYAGDAAMAALLLDRGADIEDARNKAGVTPLFVAAEEDSPEVAELLLAHEANINAIEAQGYTVLSRSVFKDNVSIARLLKQHGAECQPAGTMGDSAYQNCIALAE